MSEVAEQMANLAKAVTKLTEVMNRLADRLDQQEDDGCQDEPQATYLNGKPRP